MAHTFEVNNGSVVIGFWSLGEGLYCDENEEYKTNPLASGYASGHNTYGGDVRGNVIGVTLNTPGSRTAGYINTSWANGTAISYCGYGSLYTFHTDNSGDTSEYPFGPEYYGLYGFDTFDGNISTNIPVFENLSDAQGYVRAATDAEAFEYLKLALNYKSAIVFNDDTNEFYVNEQYNHYTVENGIKSQPGQATYIRAERILYNGTHICFYRDTSNKFQLTLITGDELVASKYSNSSYQELLQVPYDEFTYASLEYSGPFYSPYDSQLEVTDYDGFLATMWATNIPIFSDYIKAQKYLNDEIDISEAENWKRISNSPVYNNIITNITELPEVETDFGEVYTRMFFSQMYLCNVNVLNKISNDFFTYDPSASPSSIWDRIKKGIEQYGTNPMEVIQGLRFYPIDLSTVFTQTQDNPSIWIGAYEFDLEGPIAKRIIYPNGYKDLGTMTILRTFDDWRDFEPYTRLYVYLPYVGKYQLDLKKYYDKTVKIRYYIDLRTGSCCACLIANGVLLDWFDGIMGTEMPITLTDYSSYAQSQINIIMRNVGLGATAEVGLGNKSASVIRQQISSFDELSTQAAQEYGQAYSDYYAKGYGANGSAYKARQASAASDKAAGLAAAKIGASVGAGVAGAVAVGAVATTKTVFDLARNGISGYTKCKPGSSSMINQYLPQYPMFIFEIQEIDESKYLNELYGRPTNASGTIGEFSGYLEAEDVMLICPIATDTERQEIIDLVKSGIYI